MIKNLRFLLALTVIVATLSSCKKAAVTDVSILTGHKWNNTASTTTYNDSTGIVHNNLLGQQACVTGYTEFHDYATNSALRLMYFYNTSTCTGYSTPSITINSWTIDNDNLNLYVGGDISNQGQGGTWSTITTINGSTLVLTNVQDAPNGANSGAPNFTPLYHTVTTTTTFTAM